MAEQALPLQQWEIDRLRERGCEADPGTVSRLLANIAEAGRQAASWERGCEVWETGAKKLGTALLEAMNAVHVFHGPAWNLYRDHAPEMKRWRDLLREAGIEVPAHLQVGGKAEVHRG